MDFTKEQILQELKDRGKTDLEIDSIRLDSDVKRLDKYLIENQGFSANFENFENQGCSANQKQSSLPLPA